MKQFFGVITFPLLPFLLVIWLMVDLILLFRFDPKEAVQIIYGCWRELCWN